MIRLALLLALANHAAAAEQACTDHATALRNLAEKFAEVPIGMGLSSTGNLDVLTVNATTGTWSALLVRPDGMACILAVGTGWQSMSSGDPA